MTDTHITHQWLMNTIGHMTDASMENTSGHVTEVVTVNVTDVAMVNTTDHMTGVAMVNTTDRVTGVDTGNAEVNVWILLLSHPMYLSAGWIYNIGLGVVVVAGLIGNTLTLLLQRRIRGGERGGGGDTAISVYITWLAMSDTLTLLCFAAVFYPFLHGVVVANMHQVLCKVMYWLSYVLAVTSAWILVAMTSQRAATILWPHRAGVFSNPLAARVVIIVIVVVAVLLNAHVLIGRVMVVQEGRSETCGYVSAEYNRFYVTWWPWVILVVTSLLPFLVIIVSNVVLIATVRQSLRDAKRKLLAQGSETQLKHRQKKAYGMTLTLICVSLAFLLLTFPLCVTFFFQATISKQGGAPSVEDLAVSYVVDSVVNVLWLANNAINFYIYALTGTRYRQQLAHIMHDCFGRKQGHRTEHVIATTMTSAVTSQMERKSVEGSLIL